MYSLVLLLKHCFGKKKPTLKIIKITDHVYNIKKNSLYFLGLFLINCKRPNAFINYVIYRVYLKDRL